MCWSTAGRCIDSTCGTETPKPLCLIFGEFNQLSLRLQCSCLQVVSLRDFCIVLLLSSNGLAGVDKKPAHSGTDLLFIEVELTFLIPYVTCIPVYLHMHILLSLSDLKRFPSPQQHVQDGRKESLDGFVSTFSKPLPPDGNAGVFALDCEMVSSPPSSVLCVFIVNLLSLLLIYT